jgi:hypothetical protein
MKWMQTVYEDAPLGRRALNRDGIQCPSDADKSLDAQCADRPKLSAYQLVSEARRLLRRGGADRGSYVNTIEERELMKSIARHVNDTEMLALIEAWLEISIEESDGNGK